MLTAGAFIIGIVVGVLMTLPERDDPRLSDGRRQWDGIVQRPKESPSREPTHQETWSK